jgi:hypothetical protein
MRVGCSKEAADCVGRDTGAVCTGGTLPKLRDAPGREEGA